ncbi:transposase [Streptomyces sp. NPDC020794]|uniref:transposase n=1 Tax=unclassified Streptomyces TaxID=2593676 RepID=UPI0036E216FD
MGTEDRPRSGLAPGHSARPARHGPGGSTNRHGWDGCGGARTALPGPEEHTRPGPSLVERLDAIPGVGPTTDHILLAELGPDMAVFPTADHLASWAKLTPRTTQSGTKRGSSPTGRGNPWLKSALGEAASPAARTDTYLGARYRRIVKRRGRKKALVAVARSILIIAWHLINDPDTTFHDLGSDYHQRLIDPKRRTRDLVRQLNVLGHDVTLAPAS